MGQFRTRGVHASFVAVLLASTAPFNGAAAQSAGSVSAVNPRTTGTPPSGASRSLQIGSNVVYTRISRMAEFGTDHRRIGAALINVQPLLSRACVQTILWDLVPRWLSSDEGVHRVRSA
jgi:hypothetical protein